MAFSEMDIVYADLGLVGTDEIFGTEQGGHRPVLIIKKVPGNRVAIVPITKNTKTFPSKVFIGKNDQNGLGYDSSILCDQLRTISVDRLDDNPIGNLTQFEFDVVIFTIKMIYGL